MSGRRPSARSGGPVTNKGRLASPASEAIHQLAATRPVCLHRAPWGDRQVITEGETGEMVVDRGEAR